MIKIIFAFIGILFLALSANSEELKGTARSLKGDVVYTENHKIVRDKNNQVELLETDYFNPENKKIARLVANFKERPYLPNTKFEDYRFERVFEGVLKVEGKKSSYVLSESKKGVIIKTTEFEIEDNLISGSGFDNYIYSELIEKKQEQNLVQFLVLPRHESYKFQVIKIKSEAGSDDHFQIKPSSWVLRVFVKEINIYYKNGSRRLSRYTGLSNLPTDDDKSQEVTIEYDKEK